MRGLAGLRRVGALTAGIVVAAGLAAFPQQTGASAVTTSNVVQAAAKPNIVVLMTDDMRDADMRYLPRTRQLVGDLGVRFPNSISPHPLCCPARAEFLTSQYAQNNGVRSNTGKYGGYKRLDPSTTLATLLTQAGYRTAFMGKHLNGYSWSRDGRDPGWTVYNPLVNGVYSYLGWSMLENQRVTRHPGVYVTDYLATRALSVIERMAKDRQKPFFLWVSYVAPHMTYRKSCDCWGPPVVAPRHRRLYPVLTLDTAGKPSFLERDVSDKPPIIRSGSGKTRAEITTLWRARIRTLAAVDEANVRILRALDSARMAGNTVVVFTSDNGYMLGEHGWIEKILAFQESEAVPLQIRGPGVTAGGVSTTMVTTVDLAATIRAWAGATSGLAADGEDLRPLLADPGNGLLRDTILIQGGPRFPSEDAWGWLYRGVRTDRYTFLRYGNGQKELYDHAVDPNELTNVAGDPAYAAVQQELTSRMDELINCRGRSCNRTFGPVPDPS